MQMHIVEVDEDLGDLLPLYFTSLQKQICNLKEGISKTDLTLCKRIGHNLKGSGGGYGFEHISTLGEKIEDAGTSGDVQTISDNIEKLEAYLGSIKVKCGDKILSPIAS